MNKIFYFCDRKKCAWCYEKCLHTADPEHALSRGEWPFTRDMLGNYVQVYVTTYDHEVVEAIHDSADNRTGENV